MTSKDPFVLLFFGIMFLLITVGAMQDMAEPYRPVGVTVTGKAS